MSLRLIVDSLGAVQCSACLTQRESRGHFNAGCSSGTHRLTAGENEPSPSQLSRTRLAFLTFAIASCDVLARLALGADGVFVAVWAG